MQINPIILEKIKSNNNMITTAQVIELGFSRTILSKYVKAGLLERSRQGIYILSDSVHDDMCTLMMRSDKIVFSHDTALFLNGYYIKPELHLIGVIEKKNTMGNVVRCYDTERTICDILRSRHRIDEETVISAVKNYAASPDKDLNRLAVYASMFRVDKELKRYMEVLL